MLILHKFGTVLGTVICVGLVSCASVPPQVAQVHLKEKEIIGRLNESHLAVADAYMDKRLEQFEHFYFNKYGPVYYKNWMKNFSTQEGRSYDPEKDFPVLYQDLVAEYQGHYATIDQMRAKLRQNITMEYRNALDAHKAVGEWLDTVKRLNEAQRQAGEFLLESIRPELSLDEFDEKIGNIRDNLIPPVEAQ